VSDETPDDGPAEVTRLPTARPDPPPVRPSGPRGLHAFATGTMALCAIVGIVLTLLLVTVNWTSYSRRIVVVALVSTTVVFVLSAATAVLAGARATYPRNDSSAQDDD
jgi:hypothetical protein